MQGHISAQHSNPVDRVNVTLFFCCQDCTPRSTHPSQTIIARLIIAQGKKIKDTLKCYPIHIPCYIGRAVGLNAGPPGSNAGSLGLEGEMLVRGSVKQLYVCKEVCKTGVSSE